MEHLTRSVLQDLVAVQEEPCVSLFLPQERSPAQAHKNIETLRSALANVEAELKLRGLSVRGSAQFLATARELEAELAMSPGGEGMAVFVSPSFFRAYVLPFSLDERLVISGHFHLLPILPFLMKDLSFCMIAISERAARFLEGDSQGLREVTIENMPTSLKDAWKGFEHTEESLQSHSVSGGGGKQTAMFHGQGGAKDQALVEMTVYLQKVTRCIDAFLRESTTPLIFAGVEKLYGLYKKFNEYAHMLPTYVKGNPDRKSTDELRDAALPFAVEVEYKARTASGACTEAKYLRIRDDKGIGGCFLPKQLHGLSKKKE